MKIPNVFLALAILIVLQLVAVAAGTGFNRIFNQGGNRQVGYALTLCIASLLNLVVYFGFIRARLMSAPVSLPPLSKLPGFAMWSLFILGGMFLLFVAAENSVRLLWVRATWQMVFMAMIVALYAGILEEILFRDMLLRWTLPHTGLIGALVLQGVLFSAWHFKTNTFYLGHAINWALSGIVLASIFIVTKNIYYSILVHFANNFCLGLFNGFSANQTYYPGIVLGEPSEMQFYLIKTWQAGTIGIIFYMLWKQRANKTRLLPETPGQ